MTLLSAVLADSINDVSSTRKVYLLAAALALLGVVLIVVTVWFWRTSRHDPELLAPLETMGKKKFRTLDTKTQQTLLDAARPPDAEPMRWGLVRGPIGATPEPEVDLREVHRRGSESYDDLREPPAGATVAAAAAAVDEGAVAEEDGPPAEVADVPAEAVEAGAGNGEVAASEPVEEPKPVPAAVDGTAPMAKPPADPTLLIVPLDHDLVAQREDPPARPATAPVNDHEPVAEDESARPKPAIDPLLRMFEGN
jgi:hypothetical protein